MFSVTTATPEQTWDLGRVIGSLLDSGDLVCLYGDLGAGKTNLAYGIALGLGVQEEYVTSPTFSFVNQYEGRVRLYHLDLYRISDSAELETIGFDEYIDADGVTVVEWADRAEDELPDERLSIYLTSLDATGREVGLLGEGEHYTEIVEKVKKAIIGAA